MAPSSQARQLLCLGMAGDSGLQESSGPHAAFATVSEHLRLAAQHVRLPALQNTQLKAHRPQHHARPRHRMPALQVATGDGIFCALQVPPLSGCACLSVGTYRSGLSPSPAGGDIVPTRLSGAFAPYLLSFAVGLTLLLYARPVHQATQLGGLCLCERKAASDNLTGTDPQWDTCATQLLPCRYPVRGSSATLCIVATLNTRLAL